MMMGKTRFWVWLAIFSILLSGSVAQAGVKGRACSSSRGGGKAVIKGSSKAQKVRVASRSNGYSRRASKGKSSVVQDSFDKRQIR